MIGLIFCHSIHFGLGAKLNIHAFFFYVKEEKLKFFSQHFLDEKFGLKPSSPFSESLSQFP